MRCNNISFSRIGNKRSIYKVVILGDGAVGKTSLRYRYLGEGFKKNYMATIGADFAIKRLANNKTIQIWDLAGQPRFSVVREGYYQGTKGGLLVFDISRPESFYNIPSWISELLDNVDSEDIVPLALVGNKADLRVDGDENQVTQEQAIEYARQLSEWSELDVPYVEASAKTGLNVDRIFQVIIDNIDYRSGSSFNNS